MINDAIKGYYFVTGGSLSRRGDIYDVRRAIRCGVSVVQYRNKTGSSRAFYEEALKMRRICSDVLFIINDRIDIALAVDADGVHIGQDDMPLKAARKILGPKKIIGVSVRTYGQARTACRDGADYLGVGPIYSTQTKPDAERPTGAGLIRRIKKEFDIPVAAIGGIALANAREVIDAGADAICAISAVVASRDIAVSILTFKDLFK
ncbi:MAG: thiamine phosphate synthase [Candidatus Omnitrophica bacterium]|jgi:thiamine-phosphate pyrophosphorylase|nr:thiamine phosphate synthase [Candidatus Omnitrophota bacterium]